MKMEPRMKAKNALKARFGDTNGNFKHGGYCEQMLNEEEKKFYEDRKKQYMKNYPYLKEPAMQVMLRHVITMEIQMERILAFLMDTHIPISESVGAGKRLDALRRTYSLYLTRMGITYVSRERRKERLKKKTPLEKLTEE